MNVALVARRVQPMTTLAEKFTATYGVQIRIIELDLARADAAQIVERKTADLEIGIVVYNAALSTIGGFFETLWRPCARD